MLALQSPAFKQWPHTLLFRERGGRYESKPAEGPSFQQRGWSSRTWSSPITLKRHNPIKLLNYKKKTQKRKFRSLAYISNRYKQIQHKIIILALGG